MIPHSLGIGVLGVVAIIAATVAFTSFLRSRSDDKKVAEEITARVQLSREETRRYEILAKTLERSKP